MREAGGLVAFPGFDDPLGARSTCAALARDRRAQRGARRWRVPGACIVPLIPGTG